MKAQYIGINSFGTYYYSDKEMTKLHREDGPAVELADGSKIWSLNGKCHREDGPAIENADGTKHCWFLSGKNITQEKYALLTKKDTTININGKEFTLEELNSLIKTVKK